MVYKLKFALVAVNNTLFRVVEISIIEEPMINISAATILDILVKCFVNERSLIKLFKIAILFPAKVWCLVLISLIDI